MKSIKSILLLFVISSCNNGVILDKDSYINVVEGDKSGLTVVKKIGDIQYSLTLCPTDYIIAKEFRVEQISRKNFERRYKDLKGEVYFKLKLSTTDKNAEVVTIGAENEQELKDRLEYLSYGFDENIYIVKNNKLDTLPVSMYHFERTYGVTPNLELMFSFADELLSDTTDKKIQVLINDNLFNNTLLSYEFEKSNYQKAPRLKLY